MTAPSAPRPRSVVAGALALAVAVAVGLGVVVRGTVPSWELDGSRWFTSGPGLVARPLWSVMQFGAVLVALVVGALVMGRLRGARGAVAAVSVVGAAWLVAKVAKGVVDRGRPGDYLPSVDTRFEPLLHGHGYPSGHTCVAFALATLVDGSLAGWWRAVPWVIATLVAVGRLYFGAHLPLDVVGGAALGVAVGLAGRLAFGIDRPAVRA